MEVFSNCLSRLSIKSTNQFNRIIITDSTGFQLPSEFKDIFKGSNGSASEAGIKFQVTNDLLTGNIVSLDISDGRESDCKYLNKLEKLADKGDLCLKDLGYFSLKHLKELKENESCYISKLKKNTNVFVENKELEYFKDGRIKKESIYKKLDLVEESKKMSTNETKELEVYIGSNKSNRIKARMIIFKFSDDITKEREAKMKRATSKKGQTVSENSKLLSNVNFLITNVASNELSKELIYLVYTLRWQIELMFKVWKSIFNIDKVKKVKRERFLCHIYGSLISILISSNLVFSIRNTVSQKLKKEISEYKTFKTVFVFLKKSGIRLFKSYSSLKIFLNKIIEIILKNGIKSKKDNVRSSGEILNLIKKEILNCKLIA